MRASKAGAAAALGRGDSDTTPPDADTTPPDADATPTDPGPSTPTTVVRTVRELDEMLDVFEVAAAVSDDARREAFARYRLELEVDMPPDPYTDAYREKVFELYEWLHGQAYDPSNEATPFDVDTAADVPFPYATQSGPTVGNHLIAIGHVIRTLALPPGSRVLEFGSGWGNTTLALARMGHHVTAIDIEPNFVELVRTRAQRAHASLEVLHGDFSAVEHLDESFDAVLFFECFHHCADHLRLLASLDRVVAPGGRILFAAEPITDDIPYPWGLGLDGESLWAIRLNGWLELGFREQYFLATLERFGWTAEKVVCSETPWGVIFVARRR